MKRREFLKALAAGSVAAVIGEAPRAPAPRFYTGGFVRVPSNARMVLPGPCSVLTPWAIAQLTNRAGKASRTVRDITAVQLAIVLDGRKL